MSISALNNVTVKNTRSVVEVSERRVLGKAAEQIASFEEVVTRAPASYVSEQSIRIPDDAPPGYYSYQAAVSFGEMSDEFSAIFQVQ